MRFGGVGGVISGGSRMDFLGVVVVFWKVFRSKHKGQLYKHKLTNKVIIRLNSYIGT